MWSETPSTSTENSSKTPEEDLTQIVQEHVESHDATLKVLEKADEALADAGRAIEEARAGLRKHRQAYKERNRAPH